MDKDLGLNQCTVAAVSQPSFDPPLPTAPPLPKKGFFVARFLSQDWPSDWHFIRALSREPLFLTPPPPTPCKPFSNPQITCAWSNYLCRLVANLPRLTIHYCRLAANRGRIRINRCWSNDHKTSGGHEDIISKRQPCPKTYF